MVLFVFQHLAKFNFFFFNFDFGYFWKWNWGLCTLTCLAYNATKTLFTGASEVKNLVKFCHLHDERITLGTTGFYSSAWGEILQGFRQRPTHGRNNERQWNSERKNIKENLLSKIHPNVLLFSGWQICISWRWRRLSSLHCLTLYLVRLFSIFARLYFMLFLLWRVMLLLFYEWIFLV